MTLNVLRTNNTSVCIMKYRKNIGHDDAVTLYFEGTYEIDFQKPILFSRTNSK